MSSAFSFFSRRPSFYFLVFFVSTMFSLSLAIMNFFYDFSHFLVTRNQVLFSSFYLFVQSLFGHCGFFGKCQVLRSHIEKFVFHLGLRGVFNLPCKCLVKCTPVLIENPSLFSRTHSRPVRSIRHWVTYIDCWCGTISKRLKSLRPCNPLLAGRVSQALAWVRYPAHAARSLTFFFSSIKKNKNNHSFFCVHGQYGVKHRSILANWKFFRL